ncbi:leucine--tRNA ligase [Phycisphaerales bacterium AB-hyl4]|uniref:Leucine--tRNA ligase n=1 Tax=Natronomicrosphaera hydrolytica TaxID=3242702 RepID=A0ABV4U8C1_9BACT
MKYQPHEIEPRWQAWWDQNNTFRTPNPGEPANGKLDPASPKFYVLDMFPYPSGVGLHVGHPLGYIATDIVARYKRMRGYNVLHPMGFDSFGLPAEQFAVEHGVHPRITTERNIENMVSQLKKLGLGYDWSRRVATTEPAYYKWTQWVFLQLYHSWFDPTQNRARPIAELEQALQAGDIEIGPDGELVFEGAMTGLEPIAGEQVFTRRWYDLTPKQQRALIDEYRLAFLDEVPVNWCPALGTVLANEEVTNDNRSERGNHPVHKRPLKQWMLRITAFAERLIDDLDLVDWPEPIKLMQRNWIGKSEGAEVHFPIVGPTNDAEVASDTNDTGDVITVFTTRPDTLFGATYMVLAPEHPLVEAITTADQYHAVNEYRKQAEAKADIDRQADTKEKTGVFTGAYAINPVTEERIPIWVADYVMMGYGTGAIMAVPAHDDRDFAFAKQFDLPIRAVVMPDDDWLEAHAIESQQNPGSSASDAYLADAGAFDNAFVGHGEAVNSVNDEITLNGLPTADAKQAMIQWLKRKDIGHGQVQYKLRDWLFSRQRYWGEPFPIAHCPEGGTKAIDEADLPVELPEMEDFRPAASDDPAAPPQPPLGRAPESWKYVEIDGERCQRELNTMPQWAGSCWYYLRFLDPQNSEQLVGQAAEQYWMQSPKRSGGTHAGGVDLYVGGVEHAVLHLLYARFWHKVLYDLGHVSTPEPFGRLFNQGYIQAYYYEDQRGMRVPVDEVVDQDGKPAREVQDEKGRQFFHQGKPVKQMYGKMGKSLKNAVAPDDVINEHGADALRLYLMYLGPLDQSKVWSSRDIVGVSRFLQRLWRNLVNEDTGDLLATDSEPDDELRHLLHKSIKRVTDALDSLSLNVGIAALIELNNALVALDRVPREVAEPMVRMLSPLAPHVAEELWHRLGKAGSVADADWPSYDESLLTRATVELPVQINGKMRGKITLPADADEAAVETAAKADPKIAAAIEGKTLRKVIVVPGRMVNLVAN